MHGILMNFLGQATIPNGIFGEDIILVVNISFYFVDRLINLDFCVVAVFQGWYSYSQMQTWKSPRRLTNW